MSWELKCRSLAVIGPAMFMFVACAEAERPRSAGFTQRDSAGVVISANSTPVTALKPVFTIDSAPRLRIGVEAGEEQLQFSEITGVARLEDGRIAVANGRPLEVRIFSPEGKFLRTVGSRGQGPGEFESLGAIAAGHGDTVFVVDDRHTRILRYTVSGGFVGMTSMSRDSIQRRMAPMSWTEGMREPLLNGSVVLAAQPPTDGPLDGSQFPTGELFRRQRKAVWISADYSRSIVLGDIWGIQQMFIDVGGGRREAVIPQSSRWQQTIVGGRLTRLCTAGNEAPEALCIDQHGSHTIIRWAQDDVATTQQEIDEWREGMRADAQRTPRPGAAQNVERILAGIIIPPTKPPVYGLFIDSDSRVFVSSPDLTGPPGWIRMRVFSADGELLGVADIPPMTRPFDLGRDHLVGSWRNDDEVEFVVVHNVRRP